jgi:alpha-L-rhamnosidase
MNRLTRHLLLAVAFIAATCSAAVENLRCEYLVNPLGIDSLNPRLGWIIDPSRRGEEQSAYRILVASSQKLLDNDEDDLWDSGKVKSGESSQIEYAGQPLGSREECFWKVRVWDRDDQTDKWS